MAAYAALVSLMNTIQDITNHPQISTFFDKKHTQTLFEKTSSLLDFIEANNYGKEAEDLEREIISAAQTAEETINLHIMDQISAETTETILTILKRKLSTWINVLLLGITSTPYNSLKGSLNLQQKIEDMDAVMKRANEFKGKWRWEHKQHTHVPVTEIEETAMVGVDAELNELLDKLTQDPKSRRETLSIVGMGGTGKTTLAKNIFENQLIKEYFDFRGWVTISQQPNAQEILTQLGNKSSSGEMISDLEEELQHDSEKIHAQNDLFEILEELENEFLARLKNNSSSDIEMTKLEAELQKKTYEINRLGEKLHKNLFGRRYLIILDDIWSAKVWDEVRLFFPDNNNGSKIVLTTRLSSVAKDCGSSLFMMRFLDEGNSWKLFCEKAFKNESCPPELCGVGEEIVELCRGLPLSIVVMGGLLSKSPRNVEYWECVVRDIKSISRGSLDVLSLSYNHLPAHLKPCFLYMGVFDEDSEVHVSEVVRLWIGEGFIKPSGCGVLEEIGEGYIKDLIDRNLILVRRWRKNGKIGCFGIHDLVRDMCIQLGEQQQFFSMARRPNPIARDLIPEIVNSRKDRIPRARSILASSLYRLPIKQGLQRVLKTGSKVNSHSKLYENVNLHHQETIGGFSLLELPTSVSLVWNLQTLIIQGYFFNSVVVAPPEIWKMRQLRHVECGKIYLPPYNRLDQDELLILKNLQTLKTALNLKLCIEVCEVIPNIITLYLCYDESIYGYDDCLIDYLCNLDRMDKLESLKLEINYNMLKEKPTFPNSLKKLSLEGCCLHWDDLTMIGSLPQLEVLILGYLSVVGDRWSPTTGQFRCLKFLKFDRNYLEYWDADESHFPVLKKLVFCCISSLKEIPLEIGDIPTLELIRVEHCSDSVKISAAKIKEDQLDKGNDSLQIQICMLKHELDDFKEKVKSEELSVSDLQLESD